MSRLPSFFDMSKVGARFVPKIAAAMAEGDAARWKPARTDAQQVVLYLIDYQDDFVFPDGALPVPGAVGDVQRLIEFLLRAGPKISTIAPTMDTHYPFMIFFPSWWANAKGEHPTFYTMITEDDVRKGVWRALIEPNWSHEYVSKLARAGKYVLMIWPYHCMDFTPGINLVPTLAEAITYWAAARKSQPVVIHKGHIPQSEFYGPVRPEVDVPGVVGGTINTPFLNLLAKHDRIIVAGEAKSHCVLSGMKQLVDYFGPTQPDVLKRIIFLEDCTSSVQNPQVDFEAIASAELKEMSAKHGIQLVKSTDVTL